MIIQNTIAMIFNEVTGIATIDIDVQTAGFVIGFFFLTKLMANLFYMEARWISNLIKKSLSKIKNESEMPVS